MFSHGKRTDLLMVLDIYDRDGIKIFEKRDDFLGKCQISL